MNILRIACFLVLFALPVSVGGQETVVKIYAERPNGTSQGTGFFSSDDGQIVTAYHVVEGGRKISVFHEQLGSFTDILVEFVAPEYDLAVLRLVNLIGKTPSLSLNTDPGLVDQLYLKGYPRGGVLQQFQAFPTTRGRFVNSHTIRDARQRRLFDGEIDIIPLDASVYSGMSGGPVLGPSGVIGVLSGSYDEGGGIGWAIPSKYLQSLTIMGSGPNEITWPRLSLMANTWRNLRANVILNAEAGAVFGEFTGEAETLARIFGEMYELAGIVHIQFLAHRPFLERVIQDPILRNNWEKADRFLEPTGSQAFSNFKVFLNLQTEFAEVGRQFGMTMARVTMWITHESGLSDRRGQQLGREIRKIRNQIADLTQGMDAYLGIDRDRILRATPALMQGLSETSGRPGDQARVQLEFVDAWLPAIEKYAGPDALIFMTRAVGANRQIALLFEPIVYEVR